MRVHSAHQTLDILRFLIVRVPLIVLGQQERWRHPRTQEITAQSTVILAPISKSIGDFVQVIFVEIAKLTIGGRPYHTLETYLEHSNIQSVKDESNDEALVKMIVDNLTTLISQENQVKEMAVEAGDNETEDMMIGLVNVQEKTLWMFNSWLGK